MRINTKNTGPAADITAFGIGARGLEGRSPLLANAALLRVTRIFAFILFVLAFAGSAWACPMCKEVAHHQSDAASAGKMRKGFALSLYALLSTPYLLVGGVAYTIARSVRRKKNTDAS